MAMPSRPLFDVRMHNGLRHFADLPQTVLWHDVRDHLSRLPGAELAGFVTDNVTEAWIDFAFAGHRFSINDQFGDYWFFVSDPRCPDVVLSAVVDHFASLLC